MFLYDTQNKALATSVVAMAKHALGISPDRPVSRPTFSKAYWIKTVKIVAAAYPQACRYSIEEAIPRYKEYLTL